MNEFSKLLIELREKAGLSQKALAKLAGLDQSHLNRIERGLRNPPKKRTIIAIAKGLGLDNDYLNKMLLAAGINIENSSVSNLQSYAFTSTLNIDGSFEYQSIKILKELLSDSKVPFVERRKAELEIESFIRWKYDQISKISEKNK